MARMLLVIASWGLLIGCSPDDSAPQDLPIDQEGQGEPEGELEGETEGLGEGEPEGLPLGEGEGTELPDAGSPYPDLGDWSGYRTLPIVCGAAPDEVVSPEPLVVTATVVLGGSYCAAHLERGTTGGDEREIFIKAVPSAEGPAVCGDGQFRRTLTLSISGLRVGEWTVVIPGTDGMRLRKVVRVLPEGSAPVPASPNCTGERQGFVGTCGVDLSCSGDRVCNPAGHCDPPGGPQPIGGSYPIAWVNVQSACHDEQTEPWTLYPYPRELGLATLVIAPDPLDGARGEVTFTEEPVLSQLVVPVRITEQRFRYSGPGQYTDRPSPNCAHSYSLYVEGERTATGVRGVLGLNHAEEIGCRQSEHPIRCELTAEFEPR